MEKSRLCPREIISFVKTSRVFFKLFFVKEAISSEDVLVNDKADSPPAMISKLISSSLIRLIKGSCSLTSWLSSER